MKTKFTAALAATFIAVLLVSPAEARHRWGSCDGIHRCICGTTQANYFHIPWNFNGFNLKQAIEWTRAFPRTTPHAGVVGYQHGGGPTGHVFRMVSNPVGCRATVADERGEYDRDICSRGAIFVDPTGSGPTPRRSKRMAAHVAAASNYMSRLGAGM